MKNLFKVFSIIALVAIIMFSFAACKRKDSGGSSGGSGSRGGVGSIKFNDEIDIIVTDSKLIGTWKGDDVNGTLIITASKIGTPDKALSRDQDDTTVAAAVVYSLKLILSMSTNAGLSNSHLKLDSGKLYLVINNDASDMNVPYTVSGNTLDFCSFVGTKQ